MFSVWKEEPCLVVALSSDQFFLIFEDEEPYKQKQGKMSLNASRQEECCVVMLFRKTW